MNASKEYIMDTKLEQALSSTLPDGSRTSMLITTNAGVFESGQVFEAQTVKGGTNYVFFMFIRDYLNGKKEAYYIHGTKALKMPLQRFLDHVDAGELYPVPNDKLDPERMSLAVLGLNAMTNGLSFNDYLKVAFNYGDGSQV